MGKSNVKMPGQGNISTCLQEKKKTDNENGQA